MQGDNRLLWYATKNEDVSDVNFISNVNDYIAKLPMLVTEDEQHNARKTIVSKVNY